MLNAQFVFLWTDLLIYLMAVVVAGMLFWMRRHQHLRKPWQQVGRSKIAMVSLVILLSFVLIGLLDSVHLRLQLAPHQYATRTTSLLDAVLKPLGRVNEKSYSAPFATRLTDADTVVLPDGRKIRQYDRLRYAGTHLKNPDDTDAVKRDIAYTTIIKLAQAFTLWALCIAGLVYRRARLRAEPFTKTLCRLFTGKTSFAAREMLLTFGIILALSMISLGLAQHYHVLGTDKVGQDVFYATLKSVRTGLAIGSLTLLFMLPFALFLGITAGYFSGWVDDVIQYVYTLLSSVPSVLLIVAAVLSLQITMAKHADAFPTLTERADARLLALCAILGITGWTPLCRLLRGATLKLKQIEFIEAARAIGVGHFTIIGRHLLPNLLPLVLITAVMEFSSLVLIEAVLSYVGAGVDPSAFSWGNMINSARLELANSPVVWWPLFAAFVFMFTLALSANLFADVVRDAFDPRSIKHE